MRYYGIKEKLEKLIVFTPEDVYLVDQNFRRPTLYEWEKKGLVSKLKNNRYVFSGFIPSDNEYFLIANKLYEPSYVSLESALNYYNVIPEAVQVVTSVSTQKTNTFDTSLGRYAYRTINESLFWGYVVIEVSEHGVIMASLEKALLDYLYLNPEIDSFDDLDGLRFNRSIAEDLNIETFHKYLRLFRNRSLDQRANVLLNYFHV